jgi:hypothetical protein
VLLLGLTDPCEHVCSPPGQFGELLRQIPHGAPKRA